MEGDEKEGDEKEEEEELCLVTTPPSRYNLITLIS